MSYILDALKKSEKERRRGEQPDVFTPQIEPPSLPFTRTNWKAIGLSILLGLVLFAGTVGYFVSSKINQPQQKLPTPAQKPIPEPSPTEQQLSTIVRPLQSVNTQENAVTRIPLSLSSEKHKKKLTAQNENIAQVNIVVKPIDIQPGSLAVEPTYMELPETIRRELPPLKFAGHTYSQVPLSRLIIINNQILREGGRISPDLRLIEITRTGVVLDFRGQRFAMNLEDHK